MKVKDKKDEDLGLGVYLELLDCREALETTGLGERSGRSSGSKKTDFVYAKFSVSLVNNVDTPVLTFGKKVL